MPWKRRHKKKIVWRLSKTEIILTILGLLGAAALAYYFPIIK
jgi:hypothetical protein